ncbi:MAG TPA: hypothetical protein VJT73_05250 [Polyangiaceae bacterium]|nr:hypothetical protein [Polyangiaceae bacterium]
MKAPPPVLASDVLREDLAPLEPGRRASRLWDGVIALIYVGVAVCLRFDLGMGGVSNEAGAVCLAAAAASGATAIVPFSYLWRAAVGAVIGAGVVSLGLLGIGPLALLVEPGSPSWLETFRVVTCVTIPAALLFRSHYRAYRKGRVLLALAFAVALPFLVEKSFLLTTGPVMSRVGAGLAAAGALSGLLAFMSAPTTAVTMWCAEALTALVAVDVGLRQFYQAAPAGAGPLAYPLVALAFFAAVVPIALGLFQLLAAIYAREARLVDVHRPSQPEPAEEPAPSE